MKTFQFKIFLKEKPEIWRRFLVNDSLTFEKLHLIIQIVMRWENYHLYEFNINGMKIGRLDEDDDYEIADSKKTKLSNCITSKIKKLIYIYDFGDSWEHEIILEKINNYKITVPVCLEGKNACPPEDCGGISGYEDILKIRRNKNHPDYKELIINWLGEDFDPEKFDIKQINKELKKLK